MTASAVPDLLEPDPATTLRVACVQLVSGADTAHNVEQARRGVATAAARGARLVVLPEKWNAIGSHAVLQAGAEAIDGPTVTAARGWAREHGIWLLAGSFVERVPGSELFENASLLIDPAGEVRARYAKMHMFDVEVGGHVYRESDLERGGREVVVASVDDVPLGMSVCYDLRFPELYRILALRGARVITVPAAFTLHTGKDHWEVLLRARAIENQCFVVASGLIGDSGEGKVSYGRSMVIDPWGVVLAQAPDAEAVIVADLDLTSVDRVRASLPSLASRVPEGYAWPTAAAPA
jgi:predicted amidohydrolase